MPEAVDTLRCPTCLSILPDGGEKRCPACRSRIRARTRPIVLGERADLSTRNFLLIERELQARIVAETAEKYRQRRRAAKVARRIAAMPPTVVAGEVITEGETQAWTQPRQAPPIVIDLPESAVHEVTAPSVAAQPAEPVVEPAPSAPKVRRRRVKSASVRVDAVPPVEVEVEPVVEIEVEAEPEPEPEVVVDEAAMSAPEIPDPPAMTEPAEPVIEVVVEVVVEPTPAAPKVRRWRAKSASVRVDAVPPLEVEVEPVVEAVVEPMPSAPKVRRWRAKSASVRVDAAPPVEVEVEPIVEAVVEPMPAAPKVRRRRAKSAPVRVDAAPPVEVEVEPIVEAVVEPMPSSPKVRRRRAKSAPVRVDAVPPVEVEVEPEVVIDQTVAAHARAVESAPVARADVVDVVDVEVEPEADRPIEVVEAVSAVEPVAKRAPTETTTSWDRTNSVWRDRVFSSARQGGPAGAVAWPRGGSPVESKIDLADEPIADPIDEAAG